MVGFFLVVMMKLLFDFPFILLRLLVSYKDAVSKRVKWWFLNYWSFETSIEVELFDKFV